MMDHFKRIYWPGGMGLNHSVWIVVEVMHDSHGTFYRHGKTLARADYR